MNDEKRSEQQIVVIGYNTHLFGKAIPESQIIDKLDKYFCGNKILYKDKERATKIATKIKNSEADFVGLVEVWDDCLADTIIKDVRDIYPYHYRPKPSISLPKILGSGLLMLSKYELSECNFDSYDSLKDFDCFSTKGIASCTAKLGDDQKLGLFLTHTQAGRKYEKKKVRSDNIHLLGEQIGIYQEKHPDVPVVVFGDFNVTAETQDVPTDEYNELKTILKNRDCTDLYRDIYRDISAEPGYTYDPEKNNLIHKFSHKKKDTDQYRLDYIFVQKQSYIEKSVKAEVLHDYKFDKNMDLSDHYPLQGTLLLKAKTAE